MSLRMQVERQPGVATRVKLVGSIDEHSPFEQIFGEIKEDASLDLSGIDRINSVGLIGWLKWIAQLTRAHRISVEIISYSLTTYANQLVDLFGAAKVRSCMAPYYCPSCNANLEVWVSTDDVRASPGAPPVKQCPRCSSVMDFDEMDQYFAFLRGQG